MGATAKALWYIESHYATPLALADIAHAVGLSPFHLSRLFQAGTGTSIVRYLRGRRLSEAARQLAQGAGDILAVALAAGYASHGSFTRAFAEQFGQTPERVRACGLDGIALVDAIKLDDTALPCAVPPRVMRAGPLRVAGINARYSTATVAGIPAQWQRLARAHPVPSAVSFGICHNGDADGHFDYLAGIPCQPGHPTPQGWHTLDIAPRDYLVAWHAGHISTIRATWRWLLDVHLPASGLQLADAPDLERYDARFNDHTGHGGVEIWLPLDTLKERPPCA